ncbi:MAG: LLM class F420-dependent oxidoreductase [Actinomycetota bacterium]
MRIGVHVRHWNQQPHDVAALARLAESLGFDSIWVSETWGSDAVALATWIAAHTEGIGIGAGVLQIPARTPVAAAMSAMTVDHLSGGRFRLGLGVSGPQVVEGWHGAAFDYPLQRTREYVDIVRAALARDGVLTAPGPHYPLPRPGGAGRPITMNVAPLRADLPIYLAAMGPRNVALAAEIAEGWLPLLYSPDHAELFAGSVAEGSAKRDPVRGALDIAPMVLTAIDDDLDAARDAVRRPIALYVGAFGSREANFYKSLVERYGFEEEAEAIQDAMLDAKPSDAVAAVSDVMVDTLALAGPVGRVQERLQVYADAGATSLLAMTTEEATLRGLAEAMG